MSLPYRHDLIERAKTLRKNPTPQEFHLWTAFLRYYPVRFQRQKPVGNYIVDFYCHSARVIVELDGSQHYSESGALRDRNRDAYFRSIGLEALHFANNQVDAEFYAVCSEIDAAVKARMAGD